mgnify:CR=1 FL=1
MSTRGGIAEGTQVLLADGRWKKVENLHPSNMLMNHEGSPVALKSVKKVGEGPVVRILTDLHPYDLVCSPEQMLLTLGASGETGWVPAWAVKDCTLVTPSFMKMTKKVTAHFSFIRRVHPVGDYIPVAVREFEALEGYLSPLWEVEVCCDTKSFVVHYTTAHEAHFSYPDDS